MFEPQTIRYDFEYEYIYFYIVNWSSDKVASAELEVMVTFIDGKAQDDSAHSLLTTSFLLILSLALSFI